MIKNSPEVLIVGAGPTGLFLALVLTRLGVHVRIVDKTDGPGTTSRALAVQARTLEIYRQLGLADEVVRRGLILGALNLWRRGECAAHVDIREAGRDLSPFPTALIFPQDEHERFLLERLGELGVHVTRGTEVTALDLAADSVRAEERGPSGETVTTAALYVAGCDGARSIVRRTIGADFPGGTYEHLFYVADVAARGARMNRELHVLLDDAGFLGIFPLAGEGRARLVGTIRQVEAGKRREELRWEDVDRRPIDSIGLAIDHVHWFSTYHVHHRVADRFREGRAFILGDAAHVHSPVGGQGMNTGLGDAMNLAWKLAATLSGRANQDVLDTYEPERIAFARRLVATTDRAFQAVSSSGPIANLIRTDLAPPIIERIARTKRGKRLLFRTVSQTGIEYRASAWSEGRAGDLRGGERLPWVRRTDGADDNFAPLRSVDWQAHIYGMAPDDLTARCQDRRVPVHVFPYDDGAKDAGFREDAVYLVRPDGHVGAAHAGNGATGRIAKYLDAHGIRGR